ncbi:hypothetical protein J3459_007460 [Metarhizium acridum]|nr:hypothetical protein J3459_007460 [Metarhizium acridum]
MLSINPVSATIQMSAFAGTANDYLPVRHQRHAARTSALRQAKAQHSIANQIIIPVNYLPSQRSDVPAAKRRHVRLNYTSYFNLCQSDTPKPSYPITPTHSPSTRILYLCPKTIPPNRK